MLLRRLMAAIAAVFAVGALAAVLVLTGQARADTLILNGAGAISMRDTVTGETRSCSASSVFISGGFNSLAQVTFTGMTIAAAGCFASAVVTPPVVTPPATGGGNTRFPLAAPVVSARIPTTYVALERVGDITGALSIVWRAVFPDGTQQGGTLFWPAGKGGNRFITLAIPPVTRTTIVALTAGAATAQITILP